MICNSCSEYFVASTDTGPIVGGIVGVLVLILLVVVIVLICRRYDYTTVLQQKRKKTVLRFHTCFDYRYKLNINIKLTKKGTQQTRSANETSMTSQQDAGGFYFLPRFNARLFSQFIIYFGRFVLYEEWLFRSQPYLWWNWQPPKKWSPTWSNRRYTRQWWVFETTCVCRSKRTLWGTHKPPSGSSWWGNRFCTQYHLSCQLLCNIDSQAIIRKFK